ncbi:hypothetical protein ACP70R_033358 [Stipagrostis hirtigluma subsp. patula]
MEGCGGGGGGDPGAYAAVLKRKLDLYCAAVVKSMSDGDEASLVTNSDVIDNADFQGKPDISGTSKELSDDDGDLEENIAPANAKRMRRMLSNRESARRSRKRKQAHLDNIESQISRLTTENASLVKQLADMTKKYEDATLDNKNLIVDVETMRIKVDVNIAEEAVRRVTGATLLLSTTSDKPASSMPYSSCASDVVSDDVLVKEKMIRLLQAPSQDGRIKPEQPNEVVPVTAREMDAMPASLRRIASLENLQKRIYRDSVHCETASTFLDSEAVANYK